MLVILSFNHPELTAKCIESAQNFREDSQILLVHNGSTSVFCQELQKKFPKIQHLILPQNLGYTGGANAGLKHAFRQTEWAFFLSNDCQLISLQEPSATEPAALKAPQVFARKKERIDSFGGVFEPRTGKLMHLKNPEALAELQKNSKSTLVYVPGSAFWIHRDIFLATKGFDESLGTYWEDVEFSQRVRQLSFPLIVDPQTQVIHRIGKTCHKLPYYTTYLYQRNRRRVSKKYLREFQRSSLGYAQDYLQLHWRLTLDYSRLFARAAKQNDRNKISLLWRSLQ